MTKIEHTLRIENLKLKLQLIEHQGQLLEAFHKEASRDLRELMSFTGFTDETPKAEG